MVYKQSLFINNSVARVADFLGKVENLPRWTKFFTSCNGLEDGFGIMETLIGPSKTKIRVEEKKGTTVLTIASEFKEKKEQAFIDLSSREAGCDVCLKLNLPEEMSDEKKEMMLANAAAELLILKGCLEKEND